MTSILRITLFCLVALFAAGTPAQAQPSLRLAFSGMPDTLSPVSSSPWTSMTGVAAPSPAPSPASSTGTDANVPKRSPVLAAGLSLLLPGAGEIYAESYILAAVFLGAEAAGWTLAASHDADGDRRTSEYQRYADAHWSVVKYAEWLNLNARTFPGGENTQPIDINPNAALQPWERVNWEQLNQVEMAIPQFSHRLPRHGDQQYFELIGKYNQYSYGWEDKNDGDYRDISTRFRDYSSQRGAANDSYNNARLFVNLVVLNHVLSAIDAAWAAARFNRAARLHARVLPMQLPDGRVELAPMASLSIRF